MSFVVFGLATVSFLLCLKLTRVVPCVNEAAADVRAVIGVLSAPGIDDAEKEAAARSASRSMLIAFGNILLRSLAAFGAPLLLVAACIAVEIVSPPAMEAAVSNVYALIAAALAMILAWKLLK